MNEMGIKMLANAITNRLPAGASDEVVVVRREPARHEISVAYLDFVEGTGSPREFVDAVRAMTTRPRPPAR
jgi:hypothetical protein